MKYASAILVLLFAAGCDSAGVSERACALSVGPSSPPVAATVTLSATRQGEGTITSIEYNTDDGEQSVSNPTLPWSRTFDVPSKTAISMSAEGSVEEGELRIDLHMEASEGGSSFTADESDSCSQDG